MGRAALAGWVVASLADGDTHLTEAPPGGDGVTTGLCGSVTVRPLARLDGTPLDPAQVCPACVDHATGTAR